MRVSSVTVAVATVLLVMLTVQANASCGIGNRISHRDANCLRAEWHNPPVPVFSSTTWYAVKNMCASQGKVVAKVEIENEMDRTLHLANSHERSDTTWSRIRWIYCCKDLSDLCSR